MAAPTPTTYTRQVGHHGVSIWSGVWGGTGEFDAEVLVDLSARADNYTNGLKIKKLIIESTTGISALVEFDCSTNNQLVALAPVGNSGVLSLDFTGLPDGGLPKTAAGSTGDIVLTTDSAASADAVYVYIEWFAH